MKKQISLSLLLLILCSLVMAFTYSISLNASMVNDIEIIMTNPGEIASEEMRLSWLSESSECTLKYTLEADTNFENAITVNVKGVKNVTEFNDNKSFYEYSYTLQSLMPSTKYKYTVTSAKMTSDVYHFKTAGIDGTSSFVLVGDIHANSGDKAHANAEDYIKIAKEKFGQFDFVLSQGDITKYGERYSDWQQWDNSYILENYMFAVCPGNKEYYNVGHAVSSDKWFLSCTNNPTNSYSLLPTTYWFLYNNILFFSLDNINPSFNSYSEGVKQWMQGVIDELKGEYQYIIIYKHYPDFIPSNTADKSICDRGDYDILNEFCTRNNVDMVISGDDHCYARSYMLYNNEVSTDELKGTYYLTACMVSPTSPYSMSLASSKNSFLELIQTGATTGAEYFEVNTEELKYYLFDETGKVWDTITIKAKREYVSRINEMFESSLNVFQNSVGSSAKIHFNPGLSSQIKQIAINLNDNLVEKVQPARDGGYEYQVDGTKAGDTISLTVSFTDESNARYSYIINSNDDFGEIYGFNCFQENGKLKFEFKADLKGDKVSSFELYKDTNLIATLQKNDRSYVADANMAGNYRFYLKAKDSSGNILYTAYYDYFTYGDYNYDGLINDTDFSKFLNALITGTDKKAKTHDINKDGTFDLLDLTLINLQAQGNAIGESYVNVKFVDINGNVISSSNIIKGNDATAPNITEIAGYQFVGFSESLKSIQKDTIIKVKYVYVD